MIKSLPFMMGLRYFVSGGQSRLVSFISMLALSGMALGVGLLILVLSVMNGFDREMRERILSIVPHMEITSSDESSEWQLELDKISAHPQIREVTPFTRVKGIVFAQENTRPVEILGLMQTAMPAGLDRVLKESNVNLPEAGELLLAKPISCLLYTSDAADE